MSLIVYLNLCFVERPHDHRHLPVRTHSFPTRRSSDRGLRLVVERGSGLRGIEAFGLGQLEQDLAVADVAALLEVGLEKRDLEPRLRLGAGFGQRDRKSTRMNSSHSCAYRMPSSA